MAFVITKPLEEHKIEAIARVNAKAGDKITILYPIYRQLNIGREPTSSEAITMYTYIDSIRDLSNTATNSINLATTVAQVREIEATFTTSLLSI